jgi:TatA/E family protein of Tat protein translocase
MFGMGTKELVIILILALLFFGPKKLPEIGKSLGSAMRELRRASNDFMSAIDTNEPEDPPRHSSFEPEAHENTWDETVHEEEAHKETEPTTHKEGN